MAQVRCNTCKGEYRTIQRDGTTYFHVCPPVTIVHIEDTAGVRTDTPLEALAAITLVDSRAALDGLVAGGVDARTIRIAHGRRELERSGRRDENTSHYEGDRRERRIMRREGAGVTVLWSDADLRAADGD